MASALSEEVTLHCLSALRAELSALCARQHTQLTESQYPEDLLQEVNARLYMENELIRSIALKCTEFIAAYEAAKQDYELQLSQLSQQLQEKTIAGQNLQQIATHLERKVANYEEQYEKVKGDLIQLSERYEKLESECLHLRAQLGKTQKDLEGCHEREKHLISTIAHEKEILLDQIKTERRASAELTEEIAQIQMRWSELEKEWRAQGSKLQEVLKYSKEMENILNEKNETIARLESQLEMAKNHSHPQVHHVTYFSSVDTREADPESAQTPKRLQQDIPYGQPLIQDLHRRFSDLNFNPVKLVHINDDEPMPPQLKMSMDPYFSHFVLTSQSVKIKQDCEELLNIDAKPFYAEIVEKRVPMHLWDQWIRNKLKEQLRNRKAAGSDQDQE